MDRVTRFLDDAGISYEIVRHKPLHSVAESIDVFPGEYSVKNLLLSEEKGTESIFVIMKGTARLDTKKLASDMGLKKLRFASPETLMAKLGVLPGSASLFSLLHEDSKHLKVVIDQDILLQPRAGFHPSDNSLTIFIAGRDVETFLSALARPYKKIEV